MSFILLSWVLLILFLVFWKYKYGLAMYLAYVMLVPYLKLDFIGFTLQWNFVNLIMLLGFFNVYYQKRMKQKLDYIPILPLIIYFIASIILMPFQTATPFSKMLSMWRTDVMSFLILPFILWNYIRINIKSIPLFRNVMLLCILLIAVYGLILTRIPGLNPYVYAISIANGASFNENYAMAQGSGRMFGRISSVFTHPMHFGLFLGLSFVYIFGIKDKLKTYCVIPLLAIITINCFTCGVRSVLGGLGFTIILYLLFSHKLKLAVSFFLFFIIGFYIIVQIPELNNYVESISDITNKKEAVNGSSIELRWHQLLGCFKEIRDSLLFGKGYGWTGYYMSLHISHPTMLYFESLIYVVLCNSGIVGAFLWMTMAIGFYHNNKYVIERYRLVQVSLLFFYILYSIITGSYDYMRYFLIFYILLFSETSYLTNRLKKRNEFFVRNNSILSPTISSI